MHGIAATLLAHYQGRLSIVTALGVIPLTLLGKLLSLLVPAFRHAGQLNSDAYREKMERPNYAGNHKWNRKWSVLLLLVIFGLIIPFCVTAAPQPWWRVLRDMVIILMFYDFFYYLTHRFVFHDGGFLGGPLLWMHAVHHRQHNPCRMDSSYIHPLEVAIGLGLYVASIFVLARLIGEFQVVTIVVTFVAFTQINLHNHDLWSENRFPFRYLNTMSVMHHNHHVKFTGGNFATISLLYDWMFGTLDYGDAKRPAAEGVPAKAG